MAGTTPRTIAGNRKEIAASLFRLGATSYGGPAIMGVMQAELQERRQWVSKERFLEGLAVANMLPGGNRDSARHLSRVCARRLVGRSAGGNLLHSAGLLHHACPLWSMRG
jgi:hypothetical protein